MRMSGAVGSNPAFTFKGALVLYELSSFFDKLFFK